jgi:hypothetical protein
MQTILDERLMEILILGVTNVYMAVAFDLRQLLLNHPFTTTVDESNWIEMEILLKII